MSTTSAWSIRSAGMAVLLFSFAAGCGTHATHPVAAARTEDARGIAGARVSQLRLAVDAQERASEVLLALDGVVGTGAGLDATGRAQVVVLLERAGAAPRLREVGGVPVEAVVVGALRPWALAGSYRPVPIGVSIGNANECLPGTIGCVLQRGARHYWLSANHVLARQDLAAIGEAIVQPSRPDLDPGCGPPPERAVVGALADFEPVVYDGRTPNTMDAAIAETGLTPNLVSCSTPPGYYGTPDGEVATAAPGMAVMKLGRTTELTRAQVKAVNVKTRITFPSGTALFVGQVLTTQGFGDFGDSGALVLADDGTRRPVGMVIGGGMNGSAVVSPIGPILARFSATICTR